MESIIWKSSLSKKRINIFVQPIDPSFKFESKISLLNLYILYSLLRLLE